MMQSDVTCEAKGKVDWEKTRLMTTKDASNKEGQSAPTTRDARRVEEAASAGWATHDWALDLEPLALPPDLPPVILEVVVVRVVELGVEGAVVRWRAWASWSVESGRWMEAGRRGGRAAYKDVLWCARSTSLSSAAALATDQSCWC
jgi:hypothetical protein